MKTLKAIIFDMDGTITITESFHHRAYAEVFSAHGVHDFTFEEEIEKYAGSGSSVIFPGVFADRGVEVTPALVEECTVRKRELYKKLIQEAGEIPYVEGVQDFVDKVDAAGLKKIIATGNSDLNAVESLLERVGLGGRFPLKISGREVPKSKPDPAIFLEAARRLDVEPEESLVLEDSRNGVVAARAAGIRCIAFETTTRPEILREAGADLLLPNYTFITDQLLYGTA